MEKSIAEHSQIESAFRVGRPGGTKPRGIIATFGTYLNRQAALRNSNKLRGTGIYVSEDLCAASQEEKIRQMPRYKQAREEGKVAFFRGSKLFIKDRIKSSAATTAPGAVACSVVDATVSTATVDSVLPVAGAVASPATAAGAPSAAGAVVSATTDVQTRGRRAPKRN